MSLHFTLLYLYFFFKTYFFQLLTDPKILFLDEPTTGQDSHSANSLVFQLKSFAAQGRTVLCTIHQPSSAIFNSFDRIILIAEGRVAFAGGTERALEFFARYTIKTVVVRSRQAVELRFKETSANLAHFYRYCSQPGLRVPAKLQSRRFSGSNCGNWLED